MKFKTILLFALVIAAIGETVYLNWDAKNDFMNQPRGLNQSEYVVFDYENEAMQNSEIFVTIEHQDVENTNLDSKSNVTKKKCAQKSKEERFLCQKKKSEKKNNSSKGGYHLESTLQAP